jgi:hypothetical protein
MRLRRRTIVWTIVAVVLLIGLSPIAFFAICLYTSGDQLSAEEALRLRAILESTADPESWSQNDGFAYERFKDGDWILAIGHDSHGLFSRYRGGGTLVTRDSRGGIRWFLGHVCGPAGARVVEFDSLNLDETYRNLVQKYGFTEYQWN